MLIAIDELCVNSQLIPVAKQLSFDINLLCNKSYI